MEKSFFLCTRSIYIPEIIMDCPKCLISHSVKLDAELQHFGDIIDHYPFQHWIRESWSLALPESYNFYGGIFYRNSLHQYCRGLIGFCYFYLRVLSFSVLFYVNLCWWVFQRMNICFILLLLHLLMQQVESQAPL